MATTDPVLPDSVPEPPTSSQPPLPKLTQHEFRIYNRMAEHMDYFHNNFRETWKVLYAACETGKRGKGMSIRQFIGLGQQFCSHLEMHHGIEERYLFKPLHAIPLDYNTHSADTYSQF
jgi:hemerythrin-like domain-containing protein